MEENENQKSSEEKTNIQGEVNEITDKEETKEDNAQEKNEVNKPKEKEQEVKKEEKEEKDNKNEEIKEEKIEEKDKQNEETKKEEKEEDDDDQKKLIKSINELKSESIKAKAIILYDLNEDMKSQYLDNYKSEKVAIELKELDNFLNYLNKIREIINSSTDNKDKIISLIEKENKEKYSISEKEGEKMEFTPIKNFWSISLINAKFFEFNEKDKKVIENIIDIKFIPLEYPSFKIEFIFKDNDYLEENTLFKIYHFEKDDKERIEKSEGCEINWKSDDKNPTLKTTIKRKKKTKEIITKDVDSFFNIFKRKDKEENLEKELVEANFFRNDFLQNMLEYYLNIMDIKFSEDDDNEEDEKNEK